MGWKYRQGYTGRNYHVTGGHERQAMKAERAKKPTRIGLFVLRALGLKNPPAPAPSVRSATPSHERRRRR